MNRFYIGLATGAGLLLVIGAASVSNVGKFQSLNLGGQANAITDSGTALTYGGTDVALVGGALGAATATTAAANDNSTKVATTAYVQTELTAYASDAVTFTNKKISYSAALASDDTYDGIQITGLNNSGGVTQWDVVYLNGSSAWVLADANGASTYPAHGLVVATASTGAASTVITSGTVRNDAWNWTPGGNIYLSTTAGSLTQTAPSTTGDKVQVIGYALTADIMAVNPSADYGTAP